MFLKLTKLYLICGLKCYPCENFWSTIQLFAQVVTTHANREMISTMTTNLNSMASRLRGFSMMNPPMFLGSKVGKDP